MARCKRCGKFLLVNKQDGYCKNCFNQVQSEEEERLLRQREEEEQRKREEEQRRREEEQRRREEEQRRREEEQRRREEEERKLEEEQRKREEEQHMRVVEIIRKKPHGQEDLLALSEYIFKNELDENCRGRMKCQPIVKEDFKIAFALIKECMPLQDKVINQMFFNDAVADKRAGLYAQASRQYIAMTFVVGALAVNVATAWIKTLASAGDIEDALTLGEYVLSDTKTERINTMSWSLLQHNVDTLKSLVKNRDWYGLANRCDEVSGGFGDHITLDEIDVYRNRSK